MKYGTKFAEGFGFYIFVCFQSADGLAVNSAFLTKLIGGYAFVFHGNPKSVKYNDSATLQTEKS